MGMRIHKVLGWGLDDLQVDEFTITDKRIDEVFRLDGEETLYERSEDFVKWFVKPKSRETILKWCGEADKSERALVYHGLNCDVAAEFYKKSPENKKKLFYSGNLCTFNPEFGLSNVMMFHPLEDLNFSRYDDTIDYYDSQRDLSVAEVKDLSKLGGIHPFNMHMIRTKEKDPPGFYESLKRSGWSDYFINLLEKGSMIDRQEYLLRVQPAGLADCYRANIATSVIAFTRYIKIFTDWQTTIQQFKPMLYTYWA